MDKIDLSILEKIPDPNMSVILEIEPLAPLSMVSDLPGSFYKSLKKPSKKMLCGLFENILGWHIDLADRKLILKELQKLRKKQNKSFNDPTIGSTYIPFLMDYFEIELTIIPHMFAYDDLWSKAYRRADATVHAKGTQNISFEILTDKRNLKLNDKGGIDEDTLAIFFKDNLDKYPLYYSTPTTREYIYIEDKYQIKITMDGQLYNLLKTNLNKTNMGYLGHNEGWVNLNLKRT